MPTVGDLFHSLKVEDVIAEIARHYEGQRETDEDYASAWAKIMTMQPTPTKMICGLYQEHSLDTPSEPYVGVHGRITGEVGSYAIEYSPWSEWLTMPVELEPALVGMSDAEMLAHIFWEMTWAGCDEPTIQGQLTDIMDLCEEAKDRLGEPTSH